MIFAISTRRVAASLAAALTVATLTRGATLAAVDAGVPAATIVSFLRDHASPHVAARVPAVPETVTDQLRLWAASRDRVAAVPAVREALQRRRNQPVLLEKQEHRVRGHREGARVVRVEQHQHVARARLRGGRGQQQRGAAVGERRREGGGG
jgi:hypothetical protein